MLFRAQYVIIKIVKEVIIVMALKRKIYQNLLNWKNSSKGSTAIMIDGARRVGKSYVAEEFAKNEYKSYIIIDFANISPEIEKLFIYERYDCRRITINFLIILGSNLIFHYFRNDNHLSICD